MNVQSPVKGEGDRKPPLVDCAGLRIVLAGNEIVAGIDLSIRQGELACLVGESGSGKSLTALSLMGLLPEIARVDAQRMLFEGRDLADAGEEAMRGLRGNRMAMVFQEPMTSLNPVMRIGEQLVEPLMNHRGLTRTQARAEALDIMRRVQIPAPEERLEAFPHQLSGGMRQRVMIAMALVCRPALLIADEPTTALDVTIQGQILRLIDDLRVEMGTATLFITHNLAVVAEIADTVHVMYAGRIVERASKRDLFADPQHPYTLALFAAMPRSDDVGRELASIPGQVPTPADMPPGCRFAPRCPFAIEACRREDPPLREISPGHLVACLRAPVEEIVP